MGFQSLHNSFVEVSDESCHKQEYSILCHERFWQSIPAKVIVHVIEDAFLATTKIVEFHDVSCTRLVIVSQYTSVGIFAFPNVKVSIIKDKDTTLEEIISLAIEDFWDYQEIGKNDE